jgi:hypothetical protein
MTELKTLKDLHKNKWKAVITIEDLENNFEKIDDFMHDRFIFYSKNSWVWKNDLKAEAIKWVKQHRKIKPNWAKETNEEFFMHFFNLKEEDLK